MRDRENGWPVTKGSTEFPSLVRISYLFGHFVKYF